MQIGSVLDFGSGVGRLLLQFARRTTNICYGCDISEEIHKKCLTMANKLDLNNIKLIQNLENLKTNFILFYTNKVLQLQHIHPKRGMDYIKRLAELVKDDGIFSLQVNAARERSLMKHDDINFYVFNVDKVEGLFSNSWSDLPIGSIYMFDYSSIEIVLLLQMHSFTDMHLATKNLDGDMSIKIIAHKTNSQKNS